MLYVTVACDPTDEVLKEWHWVRNVLALHTQVVDNYRIDSETYRGVLSLPPSHQEAIELGFQHTGQHCHCGFIVQDDEYGIVSTLDFRGEDCYNTYSKPVVMPQLEDRDKDCEIISKLLPEMFEECRDKYDLHKKQDKMLTKL
jgi:hypothetical protein